MGQVGVELALLSRPLVDPHEDLSSPEPDSWFFSWRGLSELSSDVGLLPPSVIAVGYSKDCHVT